MFSPVVTFFLDLMQNFFMKRLMLVLGIFLFVDSAICQQLNVMTFNIRYNNASDSLNAWPFRKDKVASQVLFHDVNLLGVQEALHDQLVDLQQRLPTFRYTGVGRDDGKEMGEYSAIFYDTTKLQLIQSKTFWLSQTPDQPGSKGWDAAITRIVTWAKFKHNKSGKLFFVFNTHFDHMGVIARRESAILLLKQVKAIAGNKEAIVTGDFNAKPTDEPIQVFTDKTNPLHLTDTKSITAAPHYGPTGTFNAFGPKERDDQPIDYIFLRNKMTVLNHATISQSWDGRFASDHFAVMASVVL
jgi:endonuclease/exonuclease/phosphatase family metal-dependent hydrolase